MFRLDNKIAIITGAASGIGKAMAKLFASQGACIFIIDTDEASAKQLSKELDKASYYVCDIANQEAVKDFINEITATHPSIDILINNAGIAHIGTAESTSTADFEKVFNVNVKGSYNMMHEILPFMKARGGVIINMASIAANVGLADRFAYSMSKAAIVGMTLSTAKDYIQHQIRCNCISPARVHTPFVDGFIKNNYAGREEEMFQKLSASQPVGRMATPEEVAHLALYLCSDEASFITGCDYPIDGGFIKLNS